MREVDRLTTERYGIPSIILMENAAHAVAGVITDKVGGSVKGKSILILCGKSNNGGDGAALARLLWMNGAFVSFLMFGRVAEAKGDAGTNLQILSAIEKDVATSGGEFNKLLVHEADEDLVPMLEAMLSSGDIDIVVDALFGTGVTSALSGIYAKVIQRLENHRPHIISVDMPSGLNADLGVPIGRNISASTTVTFTAPKTANVVAPACRFNGELVIANIGSPQELIDEQPSRLFVGEAFDAVQWFKRSEFTSGSYKNKRGHALIIAGSKNYTGAAVLAGNAAIRSGAGLVTVATPEGSLDGVVSRSVPEVMVRGLEQLDDGSAADIADGELQALLKNMDGVAIGSGLSAQSEETRSFVRQIVEKRQTATIIDADGLTALSPWITSGSADFPLILTPHEGEFMRLLGTTDKDAISDRVAAVRNFASEHNVIIVLKGERVLIGEPGGKVVVNPTGNSGLGKAGNGDTLTGILAGFVAQATAMKIDIFETVVAAVYVAGMAGDIAEKKYGKRVMTASDVRECLMDAFEQLGS